MNRRSRYFFLAAAISILIAAGLGSLFFKALNPPDGGEEVVKSSEKKRLAPPVPVEPFRRQDVLQAAAEATIGGMTPAPTQSQTAPAAASIPLTASSFPAPCWSESAAIEKATQYLEQSLRVNTQRGDKFSVLQNEIKRRHDNKAWGVNLKIYFAHRPADGTPGILQEVIVDRIVIPDSGLQVLGLLNTTSEELLRFVVCPLHLIALQASQTGPTAFLSEREILERIRNSLLSPIRSKDSEPSPYFREAKTRNELVGKDVRLVVEDAGGNLLSREAKSFQDLASSDSQVLIAWSIGKNYPHYLIVKRLY